VLDPHGAVAFTALKDHLAQNPADRGLFMETAHPVKFDSVEQIIGNHIVMPEAITELENRAKIAVEIDADYDAVRSIVSEIV
jgi:threonine synthase